MIDHAAITHECWYACVERACLTFRDLAERSPMYTQTRRID